MKAKKSTPKVIDFTSKNPELIGSQVRKMKLTPDDIGSQVKLAQNKSKTAVYTYTKGVLSTQKTKKQFIAEGKALLSAGVKLESASRKNMFKALVEEKGTVGSVMVIHQISGLKKKDARACMKELFASGGEARDTAIWLQAAGKVLRKHNVKSTGTAESVVDAVGGVVSDIVDLVEDGVDAVIAAVDTIIDAVTSAGAAIVDVFEDVVSWTVEQIGDLLAALIEAGVELIEFVGAVFDWTYRAVSRFIEAAFDVGFAIADLLETVVSESYFVFRRFINGILANMGPVGEILDWVLTQAEDAVSELWDDVLRAMRFARANLLDALEWAADQTAAAFEGIVRGWESIGESLIDIYEWVVATGRIAWDIVGEVTATIGNSIYYVYNFLTRSAKEFIFDFTRGLLAAGQAIAGIIGWAVDQAVEICGDVIRAALEMGETLGTMLVEIARDPGNALQTFLQAAQDIGQTLDDLFQAAIIDTAAEFIDEVVEALIELGNAVLDMCLAVLRLGGAYLATLIGALFNRLGSYRPLSDEERADAESVFGASMDYDLVFIATEDTLNAIIFGIQDFFTGNPNSRAFVTTNLINFDPSDGTFDRPTFIHELTHVWQYQNVGGIYMAEAIWAQRGGSLCTQAGYNYGYDTASVAAADALDIEAFYDGTFNTGITALGCDTGEGGQTVLLAHGNDFNFFNREQQGQIMMHWFTRTQLAIRDASGNPVMLDPSAWDPYQQFVANS